MYFAQGASLSAWHTTARAYFGQPPGGLRFFSDFLIAACQSPWTFRKAGLGPGLAFGLEFSLLVFFIV